MLIGNSDLRVYRIPRADKWLSTAIEMAANFWTECVLGGVMPDVDGSDAATVLLARLFPKRDGEVITPDDFLVEKMLEAKAAGERAAEATKERQRLLQEMFVHFEEIAPEAERIKGDGWSLGKRRTNDGWSPNPRGF